MPIPPTYADLGKAAKDLFDKSFHFGLVKTEIKSSTVSGVEIKTNGAHHTENGRVKGNMEIKYKVPDYGMTLSEKWDFNNTWTGEVCIEDKLLQGFKQTFEGYFEPNTGKKSAKVKNSFKRDRINMNADLHFLNAMPTILASAVFGHCGFLGGVQVGIDAGQQAVQNCNYAFGYSGKDFAMHGAVNNGSDFMASIHQKVSADLETAISLSWASSTHDTKFGVAAKYNFDKSTFAKVKVDNSSLIGLAYSFQVRDGVNMTVAGQLDGKSLNSGGHKLGMGFEFAL